MSIKGISENQQAVRDIARIIWPEAMDGLTENGRMDEADALTKAEEIYDELQLHIIGNVKRELAKLADDESMRVFTGEGFSDLLEVAADHDDVQEVIDDHSFLLDSWLLDSDPDFTEMSQ